MIKRKIQLVLEAEIEISDESAVNVCRGLVDLTSDLDIIEHVVNGLAVMPVSSDEGVVVADPTITDWECWDT